MWHVHEGPTRYPAGTRTHRLPDVVLPEDQFSASKFRDRNRNHDGVVEHRLSVKQMVGGNVALLRPTWHIYMVVLEVHRRCNCKYLLICKEDEIDGTFW